jgi:hypothetical protein
MTWQKEVSLLRSLKGSAASICLAMLEAKRPLTPRDLAMVTGYSAPTISNGLALLELKELASKEADGWSLTATTYNLFAVAPGERLAQKLFAPSSSSSFTNTTMLSNDEEKKKEEAGKIKVLALLMAAGVGRHSQKMKELLAADLALDYVKAHCAYRDGVIARGEEYPVGWLITKLLSGDPAPALFVCRCGRCADCLERIYQQYPQIKR